MEITPPINAILEKMKSSEYPDLSFDFILKLTNESERGAILIGASKVEVYLEKLILAVIPSGTKSYKSRLLNYPGPLSSFSGKIELPYAFRLIDKRVYDALNTLRKIRNEAAHSSELFSIQEFKEQLEKIYDFEDGFKEVTHTLAFNSLLKWKKEFLRGEFEKKGMSDLDHEALWDEQVPNPEESESIQNQLTIWKLSYGLTFLCLKIMVLIDDYTASLQSGMTWIDHLKNSKDQQ